MNKEKELIKAIVNISRQVAYLALIVVFSISIIIVSLFEQPVTNTPSLKTTIQLTVPNTKVVTAAPTLNPLAAADWKALI
jgi:hypothetical protein